MNQFRTISLALVLCLLAACGGGGGGGGIDGSSPDGGAGLSGGDRDLAGISRAVPPTMGALEAI